MGTRLALQPSQPIAQNVAAFQVRYLLQGTDQADPTMLYTNRAGVADWNRVQGVEVCLVLFGTERIDLPTDGAELTSYTDCDEHWSRYAPP